MLGVALAQAHEEVDDGRLGDLVEVVDAALRQVADVPAQVAPVRRQGVGREPALDREVVEVGADRPLDVTQRVLRPG
ncbi:hypothetical protein GCM10023349_43100 [Nocardioides conyzicola]|uniref:Uncharacterized protein n=1 Tax=Nocardioides conyzicola TaxID=1651781 RepID=A0ABP8Y0F4_9ACTN